MSAYFLETAVRLERERERKKIQQGQIKANLVVTIKELGIFPTPTWSGTFRMQNISCITKFLQYCSWVKQSRGYLRSLHIFWRKEKYTSAIQNKCFLLCWTPRPKISESKQMCRAVTKLFIMILTSYKRLSDFSTLILNHVRALRDPSY